MYELSKVITRFNQIHGAKINLKKTWGLFYLQPNNLALLNKNTQFIKDAVFYESPFSKNRKALRTILDDMKHQLTEVRMTSSLKKIVRQLNIEPAVLQRLDWEGHFCTALNEINWENEITQEKHSKSTKQRIEQVQQDWNIHKDFQYHSSEGLLFALHNIVEYQYHFYEAHKELQRKKQSWIPFSRLPSFIAESYELFLLTELEKLESARKKVLDALLLRLKTTERQGLVTCGDVSYMLALQSDWLSLFEIELPDYKMRLDTTTFNDMQHAIEKYGDAQHKGQLYQLAWYRCEKNSDNEALTTMTTPNCRLLIPKVLLDFMPKKKRKWFELFSGNDLALPFLKTQQALLAQLFLLPVKDAAILQSTPHSYFELLTLSMQHQLLQQSRYSLERQRLYWWQPEKKRWKKAWQKWLSEQLEKKQVSLLDKLNENFEEMSKSNHVLRQLRREQIQMILETIQGLMDEKMPKPQYQSLVNMFKYFDESSRVKKRDSTEKMLQPTSWKSNSPPVKSNQNSGPVFFVKKCLGLLQTKNEVLAGNAGAVSTEKSSETNEVTSALTPSSA